jgi:hypothetical protein
MKKSSTFFPGTLIIIVPLLFQASSRYFVLRPTTTTTNNNKNCDLEEISILEKWKIITNYIESNGCIYETSTNLQL